MSARGWLAAILSVMALAFPTSAQAYWGEGVVNAVGGGLADAGGWALGQVEGAITEELEDLYGALEVGWEGIYGAGCGVKNLVTWDGNSCATSVSESGDKFASVIRDIDDCVAAFDPTGILSFGTAGTISTAEAEQELGLSRGEVLTVLENAKKGAQLTPAIKAYLDSPGGKAALGKLANNPVWKKASKKIPLVKYAVMISTLGEDCGKTVEFLEFGTDYATDGIDCGTEYVVVFTCKGEDGSKCYPGVTSMPGTVGGVALLASNAGSMSAGGGRELPCALGPMAEGDYNVDDDAGRKSPGDLGEVGGGDFAAKNANLNATFVPGGSVAGSCAEVIRQLAAGSSSADSAMRKRCLGTAVRECQSLRAKAAAGHSIFPLPPSLQRECFG